MNSNLLKSVFISAYATYVFAAAAFAGAMILRAGGTAWLGAFLAHAPMAFLFARLLVLRNMPRSHPWLPSISALIGAGFVVSLAGISGSNFAPIALAGAGLVFYLVYLLWYSRFHRAPVATLAAGNTMPDFSAIDTQGNEFHSSELSGKPAVLMFFRGNWCPLCMAQIKEIAAGYRELARQGIQVVLISPQSQARSARLARRFDAPMRFIVDVDNHIARQLGISWQHALPAGMQLLGYKGESVLPTVIVIDSHGRIVLADQTDNYRIRPEPAAFIEALRDAQS